MNPNSEFHIFRDVRRRVPASDLLARLRAELMRLPARAQLDELLFLLLLAGELECALVDLESRTELDATRAARLTSLLADAAIQCDSSLQAQNAHSLSTFGLQILGGILARGTVSVGVPEGFAYYAVHPLDYADLVARLKLDGGHALVIGVRSIGTTLSAVLCAKLHQLGIAAERMTVRPAGHPYERTSEFKARQRHGIARALTFGAEFLVCDEGPGRSGSSLLSVAEALEREGVPAERIRILCSHQPNVSTLCAPNAARRWQRYRCAATGMTRRLPANADEYIGGGEWRRTWIAKDVPWPAVWPQMERLKYLSADRQTLLTFAGYGHYGAPAHSRSEALSDSEFGPDNVGHESGFGKHSLPSGRSAQANDLTPKLLQHMANYCAWRAREFSVIQADCDALEEMACSNFEREFAGMPQILRLPIQRAAICDNRMAPHHWLLTAGSRWLKLDAAVHGDDHFFPGPCDIAWDLAGIVVEWELPATAREFLLSQYRRAAGDDAAQRIRNYELAYAIFRLAWSKMATGSVAGCDEEHRLVSDYERYAGFVRRLQAGGTQNSKCSRTPGTVNGPRARFIPGLLTCCTSPARKSPRQTCAV